MVKASAQDVAHFEAIASAAEADDEERFRRAAAEPPGERMLVGARLGLVLRRTPEMLAEDDARADGQMEIARRRIALGLTQKA
jgi:hypothetical protein